MLDGIVYREMIAVPDRDDRGRLHWICMAGRLRVRATDASGRRGDGRSRIALLEHQSVRLRIIALRRIDGRLSCYLGDDERGALVVDPYHSCTRFGRFEALSEDDGDRLTF